MGQRSEGVSDIFRQLWGIFRHNEGMEHEELIILTILLLPLGAKKKPRLNSAGVSCMGVGG